jgi:hypothetical protein
MAVRGNQKLVPLIFLIGYKVKDIHQFAGQELIAVYRPKEPVKQ